MKEIRILFTGVGRRVELMQAFRSAAFHTGCRLRLYGADMTFTAPALFYCDAMRQVCSMRDTDYIPELVRICQDDSIDLVIPTIDTDLLILSEHTADFAAAGTRVLISRPEMIRICRDKNYTSEFFVSCGLRAPMPVNDWREYRGKFPCFIKPKDGSSSINAFRVENPEELAVYAAEIGDYIVQPFVEGTEYTIDMFGDFDGNLISAVPRIRLAVRAGEVLKTKICLDPVILGEAERLAAAFRPVGPMTVQLIRDRATGEDYYIEINPRYGGGAPLSMKAGARTAEYILSLLMGEKPSCLTEDLADGAVYSRFDQSVCTDPGRTPQQVRGVIFDLDDTLYPERTYVRSGYRAVAADLGRPEAAEKLWQYFEDGEPAFDAYARETGADRDHMLTVYRNHKPEIALYPGAAELIRSLRDEGIRVGIITDGRPEAQRAKLKALGLMDLVEDIVITDELGGPQFRKPNDIAFRILQQRWMLPPETLVYVGDNAAKDFQAPNQLGMQSLHFCNREGLYYAGEREYLPHADRFETLTEVLAGMRSPDPAVRAAVRGAGAEYGKGL